MLLLSALTRLLFTDHEYSSFSPSDKIKFRRSFCVNSSVGIAESYSYHNNINYSSSSEPTHTHTNTSSPRVLPCCCFLVMICWLFWIVLSLDDCTIFNTLANILAEWLKTKPTQLLWAFVHIYMYVVRLINFSCWLRGKWWLNGLPCVHNNCLATNHLPANRKF